MAKDFSSWHVKEVEIDSYHRPYFYEKEIWASFVGVNIGDEQDGKNPEYLRPVIILKKFNSNIFWALPLTLTGKSGPYYKDFVFKDRWNYVILSQVKLMDGKRLKYKMGNIDEDNFLDIKNRLKTLLS